MQELSLTNPKLCDIINIDSYINWDLAVGSYKEKNGRF
jgi:hypothetical protein